MNAMKTKIAVGLGYCLAGLWACATVSADAALPAFPGAEGFGAVSKGGRGGRIVKVTNLNTAGPGSLAAACAEKGPRIVVFDISGVIDGDVTILDGRITIAGQTAPGAGITINGMLRKPYSNWDKPRGDPARLIYEDIVVRFIRARPKGPRGGNGDCIQFGDCDRVVLDHISCSWGSDENIDLCASRDVTVQWCAIEESDRRRNPGGPEGGHNFGMIVGYDGRDVTIHHNLFAQHKDRAPLCGLELLDHRNNVIYNYLSPLQWHPVRMNRQRRGLPFRANVVGNYFKAGPDVPRGPQHATLDTLIWKRPWVQPYADGNYFDWTGEVAKLGRLPPGTMTNDGVRVQVEYQSDTAWPCPQVETQTAKEAYELVLKQAGCFPRDAVSMRAVAEVRSGSGKWGRHDPEGGLMAGLTPGKAPMDGDSDGMPDAWERAHGLDPADPADANLIVPAGASPADRHKGYTWIEYHINERADTLIAEASRAAMARSGSEPKE